jgi:hypothetical protein
MLHRLETMLVCPLGLNMRGYRHANYYYVTLRFPEKALVHCYGY